MSAIRRPEMIPARRRALILERLHARGAASIQELAGALGASVSTIRRDLDQLQAEGYLARAHGGALLQRTTNSTFEPAAAVSAELARTQKQAIGRAAAALLQPGESVVFDSSSTVLEAARALAARDIRLTAVTNDLRTAEVLAGAEQVRVIVPGGTVRPGSMTLVGEPGLEFLAGLHADVGLVGTHAVSGRILTETSLEVAATKRAIINGVRRVILLVDGSKFQHAAFCTICDVTRVHTLITDPGADAAALDVLRQLGIEIILADPQAALGVAA